ncbi:adenosine receptor A2a-like [Stylophora pistillata]|uniref:adenosine receptor A2a-like n=1 Tax=Stylophora pistillata TaxID=50429 RepID=UPI000C049CF7|nr:adenosine receptor A2a-like [Stylophora pistillata]
MIRLFRIRMNRMDLAIPVWFWVVGGIFSLLTVLGNGLVMYLIISRKRLHSTINWFLFSLAAADFSVGFLCFSFLAGRYDPSNKCVAEAIRWLFLDLSMTNLCALTIDRYMAIATPLKYTAFKAKGRHLSLISAAWIIPLAFHFVPFTVVCYLNSHIVLKICHAIWLFVYKLPSCLLLITACSRTLYITHRQNKRQRILLSQLLFNGFAFDDMKNSGSQGRATTFSKAFGIIVAIFFICYAIDIARLFCFTFHCISDIPTDLVHTQRLLFICNSAFNPFIYSNMKQDIRKEVKLFFQIRSATRELNLG